MSSEERLKMADERGSSVTLSPSASVDANRCSPSSFDQSDLSRNSSSRLNAQAPEFVPRPRPDPHHPRMVVSPPPRPITHVYPNSQFPVPPMPVPVQNNHLHNHQVPYHPQPRPRYYVNSAAGPQQSYSSTDHMTLTPSGVFDEVAQKILNQVEYYFSDVNLATTDHLMRFISKDPEGYVPISVVATFRKIKSFTSNQVQLANILRHSSKLVVSEDGKRVKRFHAITGSDVEELQSRIVVAENLPDDHSHQNLMKISSSVGTVKSIRVCQPQISNEGVLLSSSRLTKAENLLFGNKVHAFVEYETADVAERAVSELAGEGSWRSSLRVRVLLHCPSKPGQVRAKKFSEEGEEEIPEQQCEESSEHPESSCTGEENPEQWRAWAHVSRGRGRGRAMSNNLTPVSTHALLEQAAVGRTPPGPRMPDGTRGFYAGRGKAVTVSIE